MSSLLRPLAAITCLVLVQGFLYGLFFMGPSSVQKLRSEVESEENAVSNAIDQDMEWYNRTWTEWQASEDRKNRSRFEEEVNRELMNVKVKIQGIEEWMRNTSTLLEMVRRWNGSESTSNQWKFITGSIDETRQKARNELMRPFEEYLQSRKIKTTEFQRGLIQKLPFKFPINRSHVKITLGPLNPLEEYFLTVRSKARENREGSIVNPIDFPYVLNPGYKTCAEQNVFLLAFVVTALEHYDFRRTIRNTWAVTSDFRLPVRCVFIVGRSSGRNADRIQKIIEQESRNFGDIVQADFLDTYNNLTYKSLVGLRWATTYCPEAKYVLKIDDDTFVNMFALLGRLEQDLLNSAFYSDLKIFCRAVFHDKVQRTGKWAVRESKFRQAYYPPYCSGPAYVLSMALASQIVSDSLHVPFFHLEDVYVTGFVIMLSGDRVRFVQWENAFIYSNALIKVFLNRDRNRYLFAVQVKNNHLYANIWNQMRQIYIVSAKQTTIAQTRTRNVLKLRPAPQQ